MGPVDREFYAWEKKTFGDGPIPEYKILKKMFAEHLVKTKTKTQIWKMLCGPATGPCRCKCLCGPGIAWNMLQNNNGGTEHDS